MVAADYFGIGNSIENDSFFVNQSGQQDCLDMLAASQRLRASKNLNTSDLFLSGWSQGGLATLSFQEALEARGARISGVSTAAAPSNTDQFANRFIFNRRPYSTVTAPDAPWVVLIHQFSAFSLGGYHGQGNTPLELLGGNYEVSRKFDMRDFKALPSLVWQQDVRGDMVPVMIVDGVTTTAEVSRFIDQKVARDPRAYEQTAYATLFRAAGSGKTRLVSDMKMYYGAQDEGLPRLWPRSPTPGSGVPSAKRTSTWCQCDMGAIAAPSSRPWPGRSSGSTRGGASRPARPCRTRRATSCDARQRRHVGHEERERTGFALVPTEVDTSADTSRHGYDCWREPCGPKRGYCERGDGPVYARPAAGSQPRPPFGFPAYEPTAVGFLLTRPRR